MVSSAPTMQPRRAAPLLRALFGLLQLLPQSNAFRSLSTRLQVRGLQASPEYFAEDVKENALMTKDRVLPSKHAALGHSCVCHEALKALMTNPGLDGPIPLCHRPTGCPHSGPAAAGDLAPKASMISQMRTNELPSLPHLPRRLPPLRPCRSWRLQHPKHNNQLKTK